jgi:transcriptional regulator with XRE-family HTH domain
MSTPGIRTKIKTMRMERNISQSQMAKALNMDERNYKRIESGERKNLDLDILGRIAEVLETDVPELLKTEAVNIERIGDNNDHSVAIGYNNEMNVNHNFPAELKQVYDEMIQQLRDVISEKNKTIEEKNATIALLRKMQGE